ncbi:MAG TPA: hypothetical protein VG099_18630 [Gemmataceae bacterium]|nr:hypothetical protein [Gemmataceae bacterium]
MKTLRRLLFVAVLAGLALLRSEARAEPPSGATPTKLYTRDLHFILPLVLDEKERATLQDVQLYVKAGPSDVWMCKDTVSAMRTGFDFHVPKDGEYWFTLASIDKNGIRSPADTSLMSPGLIVVVDSTPPEVSLQTLPPSARGVLIECKVKDANPDPSKVKLEIQLADKSWKTLEAVADRPDVYRLPGPAMPEDVIRATVSDRAGNTTTRSVSVGLMMAAATEQGAAPRSLESRSDKVAPSPLVSAPSHTATAAPSPLLSTPPGPLVSMPPSPFVSVPPSPIPGPTVRTSPEPVSANAGQAAVSMGLPPAPHPSPDLVSVTAGRPIPETSSVPAPEMSNNAVPRQLVNGSRVSLEYQIEQQGPTGVSKVEVFYTRNNGMTWEQIHEDLQARSPVEFDLPGEGLYGVSLVVTNGTGLSMPPPQKGEAPDYWVEVDLTRPQAQLISVSPGVGAEAGMMHITWAANDKNLGNTPIDLYYTTRRGGSWEPIARGVRNDGSYRWSLPKNAGPEFYVRMDVTDQAGNLTRCEAPKPVLVDLVKPKARVLTITARTSKLTPPLGN